MISVLDTTAFSAAMRQDDGIVGFLRSHRPGDIATVPPVVAEIEYGIQRLDPGSRRRELLDHHKSRVLNTIRVLPWLPAASALFGRVKSDLERAGTPIDDMDVAIAAVALSHDAAVVTANLSHFTRVTGLRSCHWR